ncbi:ABC transporter ATP-binding protein [Bacillus sp. CGMCC 1.16607]|uniref:ABC transporter ATP-binding protein n=1 Tax=Bacillus sp. CGMCC 1.16607 TaxID=3351842 RepID=UPI00363039C9
MIYIQGLEKSYFGDGIITKVLENVNLTFDRKDFTTIVGPSGSGKSTLLNMIGSLDKPTNGKVIYENEDIFTMKHNKLADFRFENIGFVFQQFQLLPTLTAIENIMAPLFSRKTPYSKQERAEELLDLLGLSDKKNALPSQLSGGQQQRIAIARALVNSPKWILADEPTGNLDQKNGEIIFEILKKLNKEQGCGIILITHDNTLAESCDRTIYLTDGKVVNDVRR